MRNNKPKTNYKSYTSTTGTKTGVVSNSRGTKTAVVKSASGGKKVKVTDASGKLLGYKEFDSSGKEIKPKVTAKVMPKVTPKVTATKPLVNNKVKMATFVPTAKSTKGKSYLISTKQGDMYGTLPQLDSAMRAKNLHNEFSRSGRTPPRNIPHNPNSITTTGYLTKESEKGKASYASTLPSYVAPKDTKSGALRRTSEVPGATGRGGCRPGYRLDAGGNCVKN